MLKYAALLAVSLSLTTPAAAGPMTAGERQRLVAHFEMTEAWLVSELEGLTDTQLRFQMTPDSWTIMDVVEHLAIAEPQYWKNLQDPLKQPVKEGFKPQATDAGILWYGIDRTERTTTGDARVPRGTFPGVKESLVVVPQAARDHAGHGQKRRRTISAGGHSKAGIRICINGS